MTLAEADLKCKELWGDDGVAMVGAGGKSLNICYVGRWSSPLGCGGDFDCYGMGDSFEEAFSRIGIQDMVKNP